MKQTEFSKVNNAGIIPEPELKYSDVLKKKVYIKRVGPEHFMKKYQGFGISESVLDKMMKGTSILFMYTGVELKFYLAKTSQFVVSDFLHHNNAYDIQRFVPVTAMEDVTERFVKVR